MSFIIQNKQSGLIRTLVLIIVGILILSYLGIDIKNTVESEMAQRNIGYVKATAITIWEKYLEKPVMFIWDLFKKIIWEPAMEFVSEKTTNNTEEKNILELSGSI